MTNPSTRLSELLDELRQILEYERSILLSGNPARITFVVERKLLIAEMIERECKMPGVAAPSVETVLWLDRYNRGNSVICSAMLRHLTQTLDKLRQREFSPVLRPKRRRDEPERAKPTRRRLIVTGRSCRPNYAANSGGGSKRRSCGTGGGWILEAAAARSR